MIIKIVSFDSNQNPKSGREATPQDSSSVPLKFLSKHEKEKPNIFEQIARKGDELLPDWSIGSSSGDYSTSSVSSDDELSAPSVLKSRRRPPRRRRRPNMDADPEIGCVQPCRMVASDIGVLLSELILATNLAMSQTKKARKRTRK